MIQFFTHAGVLLAGVLLAGVLHAGVLQEAADSRQELQDRLNVSP